MNHPLKHPLKYERTNRAKTRNVERTTEVESESDSHEKGVCQQEPSSGISEIICQLMTEVFLIHLFTRRTAVKLIITIFWNLFQLVHQDDDDD